ncbi:uroporphyrinogen-III synthase [Methylothermus subterraneus]
MARGLAGRRVLVTRPQEQGEGLCQAIEALGGVAHLCPMLEIVPLDPPAAGWWQGADWLIFVSANAVRFALKAGLPTGGQFKVAAIGQATVKTLAKAGICVHLQAPPPHTSESLLAQEPLRQVLGQRVVLVQGIGGRTELADTLSARGARVERVELYRRASPRPETVARLQSLLDQGLDVVLISSGESMDNLQQAAGAKIDKLLALPVIVVSSRLAAKAREVGFTQVIEAASAVDEAVVEALVARFGLT